MRTRAPATVARRLRPSSLAVPWGTAVGRLMMAAALVASGCGQAQDASSDEVSARSESTSTSTEATEQEGVEGLRVRVVGPLTDGVLCPGGHRPCFELVGDVEPGSTEHDPVQVVGTLADGVLHVEEQEQAPSVDPTENFADHCDGKTPGRTMELTEQLVAYNRTIPDEYAIHWSSPTGVIHLGVVGEAAPHQAVLDKLGIGEQVCVVGDFARSEAELSAVQDEVSPIAMQWSQDQNVSMSWNSDPFTGTVDVSLYRADAAMAAQIESFGEVVRLDAAIEVLDGSLADLDAALADVAAPSEDPAITMTCGSVEFSSVPADLDEFPPLDEEAAAVLDVAAPGGAPIDAEMFVDPYEWSLAARTDDEMVLFGQPLAGPEAAGYAQFVFERVGGDWAAREFGGCRLMVSAVGLGPASMVLDPDREPDPTSTELPVLIREQACAGGQAPTDREIVPVVTETDAAVEITVLVAPVKGGAGCPGNPWHPVTVTLTAPLAERTVLDASAQPAAPRSWPPTEAELQG